MIAEVGNRHYRDDISIFFIYLIGGRLFRLRGDFEIYQCTFVRFKTYFR